MPGEDIKVRSRAGGEFDCYLAAPKTADRTPGIVLASAVHGVDADVRAIADEFAAQGFLAAAPDLFWRSVPGPLARDDARAKARAQPRLEIIKTGEADLADTLTALRAQPQFNGRAAVIGFCFGGPYAILGPKRLGYDAGIACHGTQMLDYIERARRRHQARMHHLGRPGLRRAGRGAGCLPGRARAAAERRGAHLPRRAARLHDAGQQRRVQRRDACVFHAARARAARGPAQRAGAPGVVALQAP